MYLYLAFCNYIPFTPSDRFSSVQNNELKSPIKLLCVERVMCKPPNPILQKIGLDKLAMRIHKIYDKIYQASMLSVENIKKPQRRESKLFQHNCMGTKTSLYLFIQKCCHKKKHRSIYY